MPLGNLTSQFFANVYLNELDYFVKHKLKVKYYIRYVDDFVILHNSKEKLKEYKTKIDEFLRGKLKLELHPDKSKVIPLHKGISFLGFRNFYHYKLLRKMNLRKAERQLEEFRKQFDKYELSYDDVYQSFQSWFAYAKQANTYRIRKKITSKIETYFPNEVSSIEINRLLKSNKN